MLVRLTRRATALAFAIALPAATFANETPIAPIDGALEPHPEVNISVAQLRRAGDARFAALDLDGDGMITEAEFNERHARRVFALSDGDALGDSASGAHALTLAAKEGVANIEIEVEDLIEGIATLEVKVQGLAEGIEARAVRLNPGDSEARFARLDSNGDGLLSLDEYQAPNSAEDVRGVFVAALDGPGRTPPAQAFGGHDKNSDGVITRDEWPSAASRLIELDQDEDGIDTFTELRRGDGTRIITRREILQQP